MKPLRPLSLLLLSASALQAADDDIPYGIEFVAGIRDGYHQRGLELASDLIDLQIQANITLTKSRSIDIALWQGAEISGDFREFGLLVGASEEFDNFSLSLELNYADYESDLIESGAEVSFGIDYPITDNISAFGQIGFNEAAQSFYAQLGGFATAKVNKDSYLTLKSELNIADSYFGQSGIYDLTTRASFTYNVNSGLSMSPFASVSISFDDEGRTADFSTGVWVEMFF